MGIPRVGICHTVTVPSDTAPVQGTGRNRPLIYAVSCETRGNTVNRSILIIKLIITITKYYLNT
jgi:hypothetical protein